MLKDVATSESKKIVKIAGEDISANKIVIIDDNKAYIASSDNIAHFNRVAGITLNAADEGDYISILPFGEWQNSGWSWDDSKPIFLGLNGSITQTEPASGFNCIIGNVIDIDRIFVNINDSIEL